MIFFVYRHQDLLDMDGVYAEMWRQQLVKQGQETENNTSGNGTTTADNS